MDGFGTRLGLNFAEGRDARTHILICALTIFRGLLNLDDDKSLFVLLVTWYNHLAILFIDIWSSDYL